MALPHMLGLEQSSHGVLLEGGGLRGKEQLYWGHFELLDPSADQRNSRLKSGVFRPLHWQ